MTSHHNRLTASFIYSNGPNAKRLWSLYGYSMRGFTGPLMSTVALDRRILILAPNELQANASSVCVSESFRSQDRMLTCLLLATPIRLNIGTPFHLSIRLYPASLDTAVMLFHCIYAIKDYKVRYGCDIKSVLAVNPSLLDQPIYWWKLRDLFFSKAYFLYLTHSDRLSVVLIRGVRMPRLFWLITASHEICLRCPTSTCIYLSLHAFG